MPDAVAEVKRALIALIFNGRNAVFLTIGEDVCFWDIQQWAPKGNFFRKLPKLLNFAHARQAVHPTAAKKVHQHGLDLIIPMVGGQHGLGFVFRCQVKEKVVAADAGGFFDTELVQARVFAHIAAVKPQFQLPAYQQFNQLFRLVGRNCS